MKARRCPLILGGLVLAVLVLALQAGAKTAPPGMAWSPTTGSGAYDYGAVDPGFTASRPFTLTNSGGSATGSLKILLTGAAAFSKTADSCTGTSLGPGYSCSVTVRFAPTTASACYTATLAATGKKAAASLALVGRGNPPRNIYWADNVSPSHVGRASVDGGCASESFITGTGGFLGVAVDSQHVYWTDNNGTIGRANLDGTSVDQTFITGASRPFGVAVDSAHIYWANNDGNTIGRANLDGTGVNESFITGANNPVGLAVDSAHVYWTNAGGGTIGRANLDGTGVNQIITGLSGPLGMTVDSGHVYWASWAGGGAIGRANLDGTGANQSFITGLNAPFGMAVDSAHIYWASNTGGTIGRANVDGTGVNDGFMTGLSHPVGVAVDAG